MHKLLLPLIWIIALISVFLLSDSFTAKSLHFFGIAGEREQNIRFQYPVEIVQVFVVDGKEVDQNEPLLEVRRHQLDTDLTSLDQEIRKYQLQKEETKQKINSQIASLSAKKQAAIADIDYDIHVLELRIKLNTEMLNSISKTPSAKNPIAGSTELIDLKKKRHYSIQAIQSEIDHLAVQLNNKNRPIDAQIDELQQRKQALHRQTVGLKVRAQFDGRIGSVNFKAGELISPYQSILSVHSRTPRFIKGFIHENILNDVKVGQSVWVKSITLNQNDKSMSGVVQSMGNRIVEYPERLKKNLLVPAWGREVIIRLTNTDHSLLFGEKVQVQLENPEHSFQQFRVINNAYAELKNGPKQPQSAFPIKSNSPRIKADKIEASGILWHPKMAHFLLISDEEYEHQPGVFIMDEQGLISEQLSMSSNQHITDLESISAAGDYIYILSSLSHNKKDKLKNKRKKLIRFKYQNQQITEQQEVDLYKVLKTIIEEQSHSRICL